MTRCAIVAVLLVAFRAHADAPLGVRGAADGPDERANDVTQLTLRDSIVVLQPGATAAFSVDPGVAEVSARDGNVTIIAKGVGTTTISIVTATAIITQPLTVVAPPPWRLDTEDEARERAWTVWQGGYESATARLTNSLEMIDADDRRTLRAHAVNVTRLDDTSAMDVDARTSMPALALEWRRSDREVVLFDKTIEHSPLTLDGTTVRGAHARLRGLELHAGVTSPVLYQNVFLATGRELVLGSSYEVKLGRSSVTPNLYAFPSAPESGGTSGVMTSVLYRFRSEDDRLHVKSELGWGGVLGAAAELSYQDARNRAWLTARHQPRGFAALGIGRPLGSMVDGVWTAEPTKRLAVNVAGTAARYQVGEHDQRVVTTMVEMRAKVARRVAASAGVSTGQFRADAGPLVQSVTVPLGLHVEGKHAGASATYRYQTNTARNLGGHGGRLSMRAHGSTLHASAFVDAQQEAATIELLLREEPLLAQMLNELGLTAASPDELARLLRENATLGQIGLVEGATLEFNPWRAQAGAELAWLTRDKTRQQLRARVLVNRTQTVGEQQQTTSASLSYSRRVTAAIEANTMLSWWSHDREMTSASTSWSIAAGLRVRFDSVPRLSAWQRADIEGVVVDQAGNAPMRGVVVRLDGGRAVTSDAAGRFRFRDVADGEHRVEAELPAAAYFVSSSRVVVKAGASVEFVLARASGRVIGTVRDDAGNGIQGISLVLSGAGGSHSVTTDSSGTFQLAVAAGGYELATAVESIPAGYDPSAATARRVELADGGRADVALVLTAQRSISGTVRARREAGIRIVELDRTGEVDAAGRYTFRGLPAGTYTLEATTDGDVERRSVELSAAPTSLRGVDFP